MGGIIVAFESEKSCRRVKEILERGGCAVNAVCRSGAAAKRSAVRLGSGIVVCGFKLADMSAEALYADLPESFMMLMIAKEGQISMCATEDIFKLVAPASGHDLVASVKMLIQVNSRSKSAKQPVQRRSNEETAIIDEAKALLINRHGMTEDQAHRFIQKKSMDMGAKMVQTSRLILGELNYW